MNTSGPLRVLYVEDDRINALLFSEALREQPGIELRIAEDGAEALALAAAWQPGLLVLDAHLPDTTGHALLAKLRALPGLAGVPAAMFTAEHSDASRAQARDAGFDSYWCKPVESAHLRGLLTQLAQGRPAGSLAG